MVNSPNTHRILVVDDEKNVVTYLEMLLQDQGYDTSSAGNGLEAMKKAKADRPDLICLDITMPKESGARFYRNLIDDPDLATIPVLVVTAMAGPGGNPEPLREFLEANREVPPPRGVFSKPIDREAFLEKVREILS